MNSMKTTISTSIDQKTYSLAKVNNISWTDALTFGILFLAAEKTQEDYPDNFLIHKVEKMSEKINDLCSENEQLKRRLEIKENNETIQQTA